MIPCRWIGWKVWKQTNGKIILHVCCPKSVSKSDIDLKHVFFSGFGLWKTVLKQSQTPGQVRAAEQMELQGMVGSLKNESKFIDWKEKMCLKYLKDS